jgi:oligopeptide/dipeptide ABC transporter ATP-binding protein
VTTPLLLAEHLSKRFDNGVLAVDDVSIKVHPGETVGLVGESGCGKSTTGKLILGLLKADSGYVAFDGMNLGSVTSATVQRIRAKLQFVPQNPQTSLNPRLTITEAIAFNMRVHDRAKKDIGPRVSRLLDMVGVPAAYAQRYPYELSGGQLQRVAIARALSTDPKLIICDEAVSALDKSVQAQVLNLLVELQCELGMAYLFISHDLAVVEHLSDRVVVMYLGRVVEESNASGLWRDTAHPYTAALLSSVPGAERQRVVLSGDLPSPANPPSGCGFRTRCPVAVEACCDKRPDLVAFGTDSTHHVACIRAGARVADPSRFRKRERCE